MRILMTNDDGVFSPGIAALARGLATAFEDEHELVVVAPLVDHSGAGAAVGPVYERESIPYEAVQIPGLADVPVFGIDGPPALAVILACIEGFGPRPDMIVSGINHGINAGRSALHSGTVGRHPHRRPVRRAGAGGEHRLGDGPGALGDAGGPGRRNGARAGHHGAAATVLNLNVPALALDRLRGIRHGSLGHGGPHPGGAPGATRGPVGGSAVDRTGGAITLTLRGGRGSDRRQNRPSWTRNPTPRSSPTGWATLTPLSGCARMSPRAADPALTKALAAPFRPAFPAAVAGRPDGPGRRPHVGCVNAELPLYSTPQSQCVT